MYKVKATGARGPVIHACGTADQAYDLTVSLVRQGLSEILVIDPAGTQWTADAFQRHYDSDG